MELLPSLLPEEQDAAVEGVVEVVDEAAFGVAHGVLSLAVLLLAGEYTASVTPSKAALRAASTARSAASPGCVGAFPPLRISRAIS